MNLDIVIVTWTDPASADAWDDITTHQKLEASPIISTGFLLHDDNDRIVIALSIDEEAHQASQSLTIPKAIVRSVITVKTIPWPNAEDS